MPDNLLRDSRWFAERMPRPDVLQKVLAGDPVVQLLNVARSRAIADGGVQAIPKEDADEAKVKKMLKLATKAAERVSADPAAKLSKAEKEALELFILLVSRPAIFVQDGTVRERPLNWREIGEQEEMIPRVIAGVGRIELADHFKIGTGFIVGDKRILTNNHVVCGLVGLQDQYAWRDSRAVFDAAVKAYNQTWSDDGDARPWFEMIGELNSKKSSAVRIARILGCHKKVDMAVLELDGVPKNARQLTLATKSPKSFKSRRVYVVGYPVKDLGVKKAPIPILRRIFGEDESLGTKRFSPGEILDWENAHEFTHDASTLAGSSGSCIVDFDDHHVLGLHFKGYYEEQNHAVPLWKFQKDVLLTKNGVNFD